MIKYAVFDWDGTIADTYPILYAAYCKAAREIGLEQPSYEYIKQITGSLQNKDVMNYLFGQKAHEASTFFYRYIKQHHVQGLKMISGALELLNFCKQNNIQPFLLTNKRQCYLNEELKHFKLENRFTNIVSAGLYQEDKPHPIACKALFQGNIPPNNEIVVIGDGQSDIKVAEVLGAKSIILGEHIKGDYNIQHLLQAIDIIKGKLL